MERATNRQRAGLVVITPAVNQNRLAGVFLVDGTSGFINTAEDLDGLRHKSLKELPPATRRTEPHICSRACAFEHDLPGRVDVYRGRCRVTWSAATDVG